ncbi:hypothetical protein L226DRAFT_614079 [Lentinus tigrinus ALCF2SS1-7]|uniref:Uncharacterized protein n=1 Tax=Lentinus tigrinus ALCF2SS1-6 TaxID=1328759 RepID=A0A5C2S688_9APHY|nr:hypothetical protein L227DRAFT_654247 [Lentinus tigrinus ALCF2SS1-6]RPD73578.1 hypothetical protein L226DRAFT_614079 [Lentinus tigrinus ALCF2SS1-7]
MASHGLPPPKKRAAEDEGAGPTTRGAKAPKTESSPKTGRGGRGKKGPKANLAASAFVKSALPIHVNLTHTPPVLTDDDETKTVASTDPGYIGHTALLPTTFATGSYGWKGNKRFTVEVENPEGGEKEKVHVILTINATVIGSKDAKEGETAEHAEEGAETAEGEAKDAAEVEEGTKDTNGDAKEAVEDVKEGD